MRAQRPAHLQPAIDALAEGLPFPDETFDGAMTTFSVHQWDDLKAGLREMLRVARGPVVVLTCDPDLVRDFWLYEYAPLVLDTEARRYPAIADITETLGGHAEVTPVPIPVDSPTASTRRTTAGRRCCWTRRRGSRARRGASSTRRPASSTPRICGGIWNRGLGTSGTGICAHSRP